MTGVPCPNDPEHRLDPVAPGAGQTGGRPPGSTAGGEQRTIAFTCPDCSAERGGPVHFGEGPDGSPVELRPATGAGVDRGDPARTRRRLPRTIAVGVVGLGVIFYLATAYSWFDASVWGGVAFFALFALVAVAYRADDNAHRRRARQQPIG